MSRLWLADDRSRPNQIFFEKLRFHPLTAARFNSIIVRVLSDYG